MKSELGRDLKFNKFYYLPNKIIIKWLFPKEWDNKKIPSQYNHPNTAYMYKLGINLIFKTERIKKSKRFIKTGLFGGSPKKSQPLPPALKNIANSCFVNASIQGLLSFARSTDIFNNSGENNEHPSISWFRQILDSLQYHRSHDIPLLTKKLRNSIKDKWKLGSLQDAAEFTSFLIEGFDSRHSLKSFIGFKWRCSKIGCRKNNNYTESHPILYLKIPSKKKDIPTAINEYFKSKAERVK